MSAGARDETRRRIVPEQLAGERLDVALRELFGLSRTRLSELIRAGHVLVDGARATRPAQTMANGTQLELSATQPAPKRLAGPIAPLQVVHADEHIAVIDKPAGVLVHPSGSVGGGTVSELAVERFGALPSLQGVDRPGIVHRLDAGTSGLMVLGLQEAAFKHLMSQFRRRAVGKTYLALVQGEPRFDSGWIESAIGRSPGDPARMAVLREGGREASTYYEVRERLGSWSLLAAKPRTGRTHQIRVHLASIDLPLLGDPLYRRRGGQTIPLPEGAPPLGRQGLHAHELRFTHPATEEALSFASPLPADMQALLEALRAARS